MESLPLPCPLPDLRLHETPACAAAAAARARGGSNCVPPVRARPAAACSKWLLSKRTAVGIDEATGYYRATDIFIFEGTIIRNQNIVAGKTAMAAEEDERESLVQFRRLKYNPTTVAEAWKNHAEAFMSGAAAGSASPRRRCLRTPRPWTRSCWTMTPHRRSAPSMSPLTT